MLKTLSYGDFPNVHSLIFLLLLNPRPLFGASQSVWFSTSPSNYSISAIATWRETNGSMSLTGNESAFMLIDLNSFVRPVFLGEDVRTHVNLIAQFYITKLPEKGTLYQAFRNRRCLNDTTFVYPQSCIWCCGNDYSSAEYALPNVLDERALEQSRIVSSPHCCARITASGNRVFSVGEEIKTAPSKVTIAESGFLWFEPENGEVGSPYAWLQFQVEYWRAGLPPFSLHTDLVSGCELDRELCSRSTSWCKGFSDPVESICCGRCTNMSRKFNMMIEIKRTKKFPQVGFGGHMISFDGGNDFMATLFTRMPSYEFGLQFWFQQNKLHSGQSILTWWTESRGRELEIADTSNLFFYHMNNRSKSTGVGINDGKWYHVAFSWRLICPQSIAIPGSTYCIEPKCRVSVDCSHVEITVIVNGKISGNSSLPPFIPSSTGNIIWGQRVLNYFSSESSYKTNLFNNLQKSASKITSNIDIEFTDRELQLIYNRIRSSYLNDSIVFPTKMRTDTTGWVLTEDEPWRDPHFKYCEAVNGDFDPFSALSANIDEIRLYSYYRLPADISIAMSTTLSGDNFYTYSNPEANISLVLYLNFDLDDAGFVAQSKDDIYSWPLIILDHARADFDRARSPADSRLGGGSFSAAPLQVPSTAPLRGSRTVQISIPDTQQPIPINLIDLAIDDGTDPSQLYSRIDSAPIYGDLKAAADDCDSITTIDFSLANNSAVQYRSQPACLGGILVLFLVGGLSNATLTRNCHVGMTITATDGHGKGFLGIVSAVDSFGSIQSTSILNFGAGYDWINSTRTDVVMSDGRCLCGGAPGNVRGNMRPCMRAMVGIGKANISGRDFAGVDRSGTSVGYDYTSTSCNKGQCPAVKPRPCSRGCERSFGWMTDLTAKPTQYNKFMAGPYTQYSAGVLEFKTGFEPVYWSNSRHIVWYVPTTFGQFGQNTDSFLLRKFDYFPILEIVASALDVPPPYPHVWVQIVRERLSLPLNSSLIWEANSPVVIQLQLLDFDRGTSVLNSPFEISIDPPSRGFLFQAIPMNRSDPNFQRDCICRNGPRFPYLNRTPDTSYYPHNTPLPGSRQCNLDKEGNFCMKMGEPINMANTLVEQFEDTIKLPGFQHARHGFHVIYYMGDAQFGSANLKWQMRHPQGQTQSAFVRIEVRNNNNPPVALNTSVLAWEDSVSEIQLNVSDIDDYLLPTMYIKQYPQHGDLYECISGFNMSQNASCGVGDPISTYNDTVFQWATVKEDSAGAVDDAYYNTTIESFPADKNSQASVRLESNINSTRLKAGYGFGSWNFNPDSPQNFKQMCGARGTLAAKLSFLNPVFVTNVEIFAQFRFDTPFRLLAASPHPSNVITNNYNTAHHGHVDSFVDFEETVTAFKISFGRGRRDQMHYEDQSKYESAKREFHKQMYCGISSNDTSTICQSVWSNSFRLKGRENSFSSNQNSDWIEIYRGLPHQARANRVSISPIFSPLTFQTSEMRIEVCGQDGRIFGRQREKFLENDLVRISGTRRHRPAGHVVSRSIRVVYVPHPNWNGNDFFSYFVQDHAGGANRSSDRFSMARGTSPLAFVGISVSPKIDRPYGTSSIINSPPSNGLDTILVSVAGSQPGQAGNSAPLNAFDIHVFESPTRGRLMGLDGALFTGGMTKWLQYQPPPNVCGWPFDKFRYYMQNSSMGENLSSSVYSVSIHVRCSAGFVCNPELGLCEACPAGRFGQGSGILLTCFLCPNGKYQDQTGSTSCHACSAGSFSRKSGSTACIQCPAGTISTKLGEQQCVPCPAGTFSPFPSSTFCSNCGLNSYTRTIGSITCSDCPANTQTLSDTSGSLLDCECSAGFYVLGGGGMACLPCPHGAYCHGRDLLPVPRSGYWTTEALWTKTNRTFDGDGRWIPLNVSGVSVFIPCSYRYIRGVCVGYPDINVQDDEEICQYRNSLVHEGPTGFDYFSSAGLNPAVKVCTLLWPDEVPSVSPSNALRPWIQRKNYSADYYCAEGYADFICSKCKVGYDRSLNGYCEPCSVLFQVPFIGLCYFVSVATFNLIGWAFIFSATAYRARSLHLFISHLQLLAILGRLAVPWPRLVQGFLNFCSWFNLNIDAFDWNCLAVDIESYSSRWFLDAALPLVILASAVVFCLVSLRQAYATLESAKNQAAERFRHKRKNRTKTESAANIFRASLGHATDDALRSNLENHSMTTLESASFKSADTLDSSSNSDGSSASVASAGTKATLKSKKTKNIGKKSIAKLDRDTIVAATPKDIRKLQDAGIQFVVLTLNLLFVMALISIFIPLSCSKIKPDFSYMDWNPAFPCDTESHARLKFASFALGVFWLLLFPSITSYILWKAWQMELIRDRLFARRFGWLIDPYEIKYFWWEIMVLVRKAVIVVAQGLMTHNGYLQLLVIISYSMFHLGVTFYCRPHVHFRHTIIDIWLQIQFILLCAYAFSNVIGQEGMRIVNIIFGLENENERQDILSPFPGMEAISDREVNGSIFSNFVYVIAFGFSVSVSFIMIAFDVYRIRPSAPFWAQFIYNSVTGLPLQRWNHDVSKVMAALDEFVRSIQNRRRVVPPERPPSRWAHRVTERDSEVDQAHFWTNNSLKNIIHDVLVASQNEEWAMNKESTVEYIRSLERRIFASEMYDSASQNLPHLERERNNAKKVLLHYVQLENEQVFQSLYDQTGENEKLMWEILDSRRREKQVQVLVVGKNEEKLYIEKEFEEQQRRVIDATKWKVAFEAEKKHAKELAKQIKQARDAAVLFYLEVSDSSEDERELDNYLKKRVDEYIDSKTAKDLVEEGKMEPIPRL